MIRNRVGSSLEVWRLAEAIARPGIDPRIWISLAVVDKVFMDPAHGPYAEVTLLPTEQRDTARVGAIYAGPGFGLWAPVHLDDEVLVEAPSGDPAEGLVITKRLWSASDPPPDEAVQNPLDLVLVVEPQRSFRLALSGGGGVALTVEGGGNVSVSVQGGDVKVTTDQDAEVSAGGDVRLSASGTVSEAGAQIRHGAAADHPHVLGDVLADALTQLTSGVLTSPVGPVTLDPANGPPWVLQFLTALATNILSQTASVERGG
jgi:Type VI secretion system/phage-baseplate injector OB domain